MNERDAQNALGTLKIYEICGIFIFDPYEKRNRIFERWIKACSKAEAIILAIKEDPTLVNQHAIYVLERTQKMADDWENIGPYTKEYYEKN